MQPPFSITPRILNLVAEISRQIGKLEGLRAPAPQPRLRKQNRIKTIQGSLAIEGNTLELDQVSAILDGKRVRGPKREVLEVENAIRLYERISEFDPFLEKDLLRAHAILMRDLVEDAGKYRQSGVGIIKGQEISHVAPPAKRVPELMSGLISFIRQTDDLSPLIRACVFHYELEFIHPFSDGNGRLGRFWQSLLLTRFYPVLAHLPVESVIHERQERYYLVLESCDRQGNSTEFVEFSLEAIRDALNEFMKEIRPEPDTAASRLTLAQREFGERVFSRKDYLQFFKTLSTATASRDLAFGASEGLLRRTGTQAIAKYRFKVAK